MCEVATIGLAISALTAAVGGAQTAANNKSMKLQAEADGVAKDKTFKKLQAEIDGQSQQEASERAKAAMKERAALRVAAGEAGVGGAGVQLQESQSMFDESADLVTIENNRKARTSQTALDQLGSQAKTRSRVNSIESRGATYGRAGLQIANDSLKYASKKD